MPFRVRDAGGVLRTITSMKVMDGTTLRSVATVKVHDGTQLRTVATFAPDLTLSVAPSIVRSDLDQSTQTTPAATATPSGGRSPYTYSWVKDFGGSITANTPTQASTTFSATALSKGEERTASFICTVTDANGSTASDAVTVFITRDNLEL